MKRKLRLVTWNVNGLRAVLQRLEQNLQQFLESLEADIICLQESKLTRSELDEELVRPPGFDAFYSFCRHRGGYSGVVTFVKSDLPTVAAEEGLTGLWKTKDNVGHVGSLHNELPSKLVNDLESEGRCIITDHQAFVLLNTYCPALASSDRLEYKLQFHALLEDRVNALRAANKRVVVVGDINIAHREIDHCDPQAHRSDGNSFGDHPCRKWMDSFLGSSDETSLSEPNRDEITGVTGVKLIDTYRHFHPDQAKAFTCWNTQTGARQTNYGTRIDYILVDPTFVECVSTCSIDAERVGSDHCPVAMSCTVELETDSSTNIGITAVLCAKKFAEFAGTQQSIKSFVVQSRSVGTENLSGQSVTSPVRSSLRSKKRGQQSITSFFSNSGTKRKAPSYREVSWSEESSTYRMFSESVRIVKTSENRKPAEKEKLEWAQVLNGRPPPTPLCHCGQPTVLRSVLKTNENWGRKFYVCTKPAGEKGNPDARCDFFKWADNKGAKRPKTQ
ncbi:exodeoxyribonuclease III [Phytophthora nicotianae CJ01A1]|uniref:DNA-(apurinic or apyrimidinic site) endonuclease n=2 Tax=Phytophthora nicotianae TaxID=4792 RepID=W2H442_PHYNI|nr:exodeoxyribonuclease III [Phytophthora nicotianae]ETL42781.1 exodeoxyribonuclease III [Phytophthora nicotianae]ETP19250.1 exodeoxyribonuclease III [Phytophthora nicotianae CJ01A1]